MGIGISDRHALVTGGSRGIGFAIARALAQEGARVSLVATSSERLDQARQTIMQDVPDAQVELLPCDLADRAALEALAGQVNDIDIVVNAAGVYTINAITDAGAAELDAMLDVNLRAPLHLARLLIPGMLRRGEGAIINIGSIAGRQAFPNNSGYCASKFGVVGLTEALFAELREAGILVSNVSPGMTLTDMTRNIAGADQSRMVDPEDIADAVLWLLNTAPSTAPVNLDIWPQKDVFG